MAQLGRAGVQDEWAPHFQQQEWGTWKWDGVGWELPEEAPAAAVLQCCAAAVCSLQAGLPTSVEHKSSSTMTRPEKLELAQSRDRDRDKQRRQDRPMAAGSRTSTLGGLACVWNPRAAQDWLHNLGARNGRAGFFSSVGIGDSSCYFRRVSPPRSDQRAVVEPPARAGGIVTLKDSRTHKTAPTGWVAVRSLRKLMGPRVRAGLPAFNYLITVRHTRAPELSTARRTQQEIGSNLDTVPLSLPLTLREAGWKGIPWSSRSGNPRGLGWLNSSRKYSEGLIGI